MPAPPTNASVSFTVPDGVRPAMLWAVGTSVGIGEFAHPATVSRISTASVQRAPSKPRPDRRLASKFILARPLLSSQSHAADPTAHACPCGATLLLPASAAGRHMSGYGFHVCGCAFCPG